jgi:hypothetical protein
VNDWNEATASVAGWHRLAALERMAAELEALTPEAQTDGDAGPVPDVRRPGRTVRPGTDARRPNR